MTCNDSRGPGFQEQARAAWWVPWEFRLELGLEKDLDAEPEGTRILQARKTDNNGSAGPRFPHARGIPSH